MNERNADLARKIIEKYIKLGIKNKKGYSKRFIALQLYNENPDKFADLETARNCIRFCLNSAGQENRSDKKVDLTSRFALITDQVQELNYTPFTIPSSYKKTLWIADLHSRFCDKKALEIAVEEAIEKSCDSVVINGDFMDFYGFSRFDKSPSIKVHFEEEREWGQDILSLLQDIFGYVVLKKGNHDTRREKYISKISESAPELEGLALYEDYLRFNFSRINFVEDYNHICYGNLNGIHGHEYQGGGGIHVAYQRFNKALSNVISAHSHKSQTIIRQNISGDFYGSWTIGCLCSLHPAYAPKNDWNQGFAITSKESNGLFEVQNYMISNKKIISI